MVGPAPPFLYARHPGRPGVHLALVQGMAVGLPAHFHDEDQLILVLRGRRRLQLADQLVEVTAGHRLRIPAGVLHRSLPEPAGVVCLNLYLPTGEDDAAVGGHFQAVEAPRIVPVAAQARRLERCSVAAAATAADLSREAFSRMVQRRLGSSPQRLGLLARANRARALLRAGEEPAAAATAAGFADQSHLGRCFRQLFGTTPGRFRAGSHPF